MRGKESSWRSCTRRTGCWGIRRSVSISVSCIPQPCEEPALSRAKGSKPSQGFIGRNLKVAATRIFGLNHNPKFSLFGNARRGKLFPNFSPYWCFHPLNHQHKGHYHGFYLKSYRGNFGILRLEERPAQGRGRTKSNVPCCRYYRKCHHGGSRNHCALADFYRHSSGKCGRRKFLWHRFGHDVEGRNQPRESPGERDKDVNPDTGDQGSHGRTLEGRTDRPVGGERALS